MMNRIPYRVVIWDFDGTIADSLQIGIAAFNRWARANGFPELTDIAELRRRPFKDVLKSLCIPWYRLGGLVRHLKREQRLQFAKLRPHAGVCELIRDLAEAGAVQCVLTSNDRRNVCSFLQRERCDAAMTEVRGGIRLQRKARPLKKLIRRLKASPTEVLLIGDEVRDLNAARYIGVSSAAVTWGFNHADLLANSAPTYLIDSSAELRHLLLERFGATRRNLSPNEPVTAMSPAIDPRRLTVEKFDASGVHVVDRSDNLQ